MSSVVTDDHAGVMAARSDARVRRRDSGEASPGAGGSREREPRDEDGDAAEDGAPDGVEPEPV